MPTPGNDVFQAIAEPNRREILSLLAQGERPVGSIAATLSLTQPTTSKHLAVLREVGVVSVRRQGRERLYALRAEKIRAVHEWTRTFERFWASQTDRIKARAEASARAAENKP